MDGCAYFIWPQTLLCTRYVWHNLRIEFSPFCTRHTLNKVPNKKLLGLLFGEFSFISEIIRYVWHFENTLYSIYEIHKLFVYIGIQSKYFASRLYLLVNFHENLILLHHFCPVLSKNGRLMKIHQQFYAQDEKKTILQLYLLSL